MCPRRLFEQAGSNCLLHLHGWREEARTHPLLHTNCMSKYPRVREAKYRRRSPQKMNTDGCGKQTQRRQTLKSAVESGAGYFLRIDKCRDLLMDQ